MKQNYIQRLSFFLVLLALGFSSCAEQEDMVSPKEETCSTMATVQYQQGAGLNLVLENGQVLKPENVKQLSTDKKSFAIDGFAVRSGQQILIGYKPAGSETASQVAGTKAVKVNCIVGLSPE
jgi:hypothetical protein